VTTRPQNPQTTVETLRMPLGWRAQTARSVDLLMSDLLVACPRCNDLLPPDSLICQACGCYTTVRR